MKKVFIEIDKDNRITGFSSSPMNDENIEVDLDETHELFHYQKRFMLNELGEVVVDDRPQLAEAIAQKDAELSKACQDSILDGFTHRINGELYHFSFDFESQLNFQGAEKILSSGMFQSINWTVRHNGEYKRIAITKEIMQQLTFVILIHKDSNITRYREKLMPLVHEAKTEAEIETVHWGMVFPDIDPPIEDDIGEPPVPQT